MKVTGSNPVEPIPSPRNRFRERGDAPRDIRFKYIAIYRNAVTDEPGFGGSFRFLAKGDFKGLVLRLLKDKPMHGYEVMKVLEERFHGFYKPSAGAIYPALRALLREGYVATNGEERRRTYHITGKGRAYLRRRKAEFEKRFRAFEAAVGPERAALFRELRMTGRTFATNLREITPRQAKSLRALLAEMRERMLRIMAESSNGGVETSRRESTGKKR